MENDTQWPGYRQGYQLSRLHDEEKILHLFCLATKHDLILVYKWAQNNRYWSTENPISIHEVPLYDEIECVLCCEYN
jgi:hypothetical protein